MVDFTEEQLAEIEKAKNAVSIPVIANGGIFTVEDADEIIRKTEKRADYQDCPALEGAVSRRALLAGI